MFTNNQIKKKRRIIDFSEMFPETIPCRLVSDESIIKSYNETGNIWETGKLLKITGQQVQQRLIKLNIARKNPHFKQYDYYLIEKYYLIFRDAGKLEILASIMGRTKHFLCRKAKESNLTDIFHKRTIPEKEKGSNRMKKYIELNGHPKGFKGHTHKRLSIRRMSVLSKRHWDELSYTERNDLTLKQMKAKISKYGKMNISNHHGNWKQSWREVGGRRIFFRSKWEVNYARYLEFLKQQGKIKEWEHEPETFWFDKIKRGIRSYLPDFKVIENNGKIFYHEVKGWMDDRSKTTIARFKRYYPDLPLIIIDSTWFKENNNICKNIIKDWE